MDHIECPCCRKHLDYLPLRASRATAASYLSTVDNKPHIPPHITLIVEGFNGGAPKKNIIVTIHNNNAEAIATATKRRKESTKECDLRYFSRD